MTDQWTPSDEPTPPDPAQITSRPRFRSGEVLRVGVVIGALAVLVASAAITIAASPNPSADPSAGAPGASSAPDGDKGQRGPGFGGFGGPDFRLGGIPSIIGGPIVGGKLVGLGRSITITKIDGSNVSLQTDDGWTRTIAVTDTTQIRIGSQAGKLADLKVGDKVSLNQKKNTDGTYAVTLIVVRVPIVAGTVTDVTSSGFTVKLRDGSSKTVTTSSSTSFLLGAAKSSKADLSVGARVQVEGTDGTPFAATVVHIVPDFRIGKVTAVTSTSITIEIRGGQTATIHVDASTTYRVKGATAGKLSDVTVGMYVSAQGLSRADGSLDATTVLAGSLRGPKVLPVKPNTSTPPS